MKIPKVHHKGIEGTRSGFNPADQRIVDQVNDHNPKVQMYTSRPIEELGASDERCADCGSKLMYFSSTEKYMCTYVRCAKIIDAVANTPLTNTNQAMQPFQSQHYDPNNEEDEPFFTSWNPDSQDEKAKDYELTYSSADRRVRHIKCKGYPSDISINAFND